VAQRQLLQPLYAAAVPALPGLQRLRWRTDVVISSSASAKAMRTSLLLELSTSAGRTVTFEVPADKLQELRYSVAKALQGLTAVEQHPVLNIDRA
jgi:hypothetical protein